MIKIIFSSCHLRSYIQEHIFKVNYVYLFVCNMHQNKTTQLIVIGFSAGFCIDLALSFKFYAESKWSPILNLAPSQSFSNSALNIWQIYKDYSRVLVSYWIYFVDLHFLFYWCNLFNFHCEMYFYTMFRCHFSVHVLTHWFLDLLYCDFFNEMIEL